jgi:hypothetical protein
MLCATGAALLAVTNQRVINWLRKILGITSSSSSWWVTISLWKIRLMGIFLILIAIYIISVMINPHFTDYIPPQVLFIPLFLYLVLVIFTIILSFVKRKKRIS